MKSICGECITCTYYAKRYYFKTPEGETKNADNTATSGGYFPAHCTEYCSEFPAAGKQCSIRIPTNEKEKL